MPIENSFRKLIRVAGEGYESIYPLLAIGLGLTSVLLPFYVGEDHVLSNWFHNLAIAIGLLIAERAIRISRNLREQASQLRRLQTSDFAIKQALGCVQDAGILTRKINSIMRTSSRTETGEEPGVQMAILMLRRFVAELLDKRIKLSDGTPEMRLHFQNNSLLAYQSCWDAIRQRQQFCLSRRESGGKRTVARAIHCVDPEIWSPNTGSETKKEILNRLYDHQRYFIAELYGKICRLMICSLEPGSQEFKAKVEPIIARMRECKIDIAYIWYTDEQGDQSIELPPIPDQGFVWVKRFRYAQGWKHRQEKKDIPIELTAVLWGRRDRQVREEWRTWKAFHDKLRQAEDVRLYLPDQKVEII